MLKRYYELLLRFSRENTGLGIKAVSLSFGSVFFLAVLPGLFFYVASLFGISWPIPEPFETVIAVCALLFGLCFLGWATYSQLVIGKGTPAPTAPTQRLVITGPYRYTRNPIEFGALFYYFGVGVFFGSLFHGLVCLILAAFFGSFYHKFVEEKELLMRFGKEYEEYRAKTPFLIPRWRGKHF